MYRSINAIHHIARWRDRKHVIILLHAERPLTNLTHLHDESPRDSLTYPDIIKATQAFPQPASGSVEKTLLRHPHWFPLTLGTRQECPFSSLLFNMVGKVLAEASEDK